MKKEMPKVYSNYKSSKSATNTFGTFFSNQNQLLSDAFSARIDRTERKWMGLNETIKSRKFNENIRRKKPI